MSMHLLVALPAVLFASPETGKLEVGPAAVVLESPRDRQRLIVCETFSDGGRTVDRTAEAKIAVEDPKIAAWDTDQSSASSRSEMARRGCGSMWAGVNRPSH